MSEDYYIDDFETVSLPKELYDKLSEIAEERFGYTGQGIVSDLVEDILENHVSHLKTMEGIERRKEKGIKVRFQVQTYFDRFFPYVVVTSNDKEEQGNDFLGQIDLGSKEALLRVAKDGYGISEDEIEFIN